jgi:hypothetical protein
LITPLSKLLVPLQALCATLSAVQAAEEMKGEKQTSIVSDTERSVGCLRMPAKLHCFSHFGVTGARAITPSQMLGLSINYKR